MSENGGSIWKLVATALASLVVGMGLAWFGSTTVLDAKFGVVEEQLKALTEKSDAQRSALDIQSSEIHQLQVDVSVLAARSGGITHEVQH